MPWPFLPPNPETKPGPFDDDYFVFSIELTGMSPHDEQTDHSFTVEGNPAAAWVPIEVNTTLHVYSGVCMVSLSSVGSKATVKVTHDPTSSTKSTTVDIDSNLLDATVSNVTAQDLGSKATIEADYDVPTSGSWYVVAAPYDPSMGQFTNFSTYENLGAQASVTGGTGTVTLTVYPSGVGQYVVFAAKGYPNEYLPGSAGKLVTI